MALAQIILEIFDVCMSKCKSVILALKQICVGIKEHTEIKIFTKCYVFQTGRTYH
jgi:hypothetical protein